MDKIFNCLALHRLESYFKKFLDLGVKDERDLIDGIRGEDLDDMGFSQVEKNRFSRMVEYIQRLRGPDPSAPRQKSMEKFLLHYTYPHCPEPKEISDMDPNQNTLEDLMLRICHQEGVGHDRSVCLFSGDGMPLTDDPFFNTWSLQDRHIGNGSELIAVFTPRDNLKQPPRVEKQEMPEVIGEDTVRCHIMLRGDYEVKVDLQRDTVVDLRQRLSSESGIPTHVLHYRGARVGSGDSLQDCGINEDSTVLFSLSSFLDQGGDPMAFYVCDVLPSVQQTQKGLTMFFSSLYTVKMQRSCYDVQKLMAHVRSLSGFTPLVQSLHQLTKNQIGTRTQKIALVEGLYALFRKILPSQSRGGVVIEDHRVFENAPICWAYILSKAEEVTVKHEEYAPMSLLSPLGERFCDPVRVPGLPGVLERSDVLQKIKDGEKIPNCSESDLRPTSLRRAVDVEKVLLSLPPHIHRYHICILYALGGKANFEITVHETLAEMTEGLKAFPYLLVTPPLQLKAVGNEPPRLVVLSEDNIGLYLGKNKCSNHLITAFDCLEGKNRTVDLDQLAKETRDARSDLTLITSRTPKEAIMVLMDTSSSMGEECYDAACSMTRLEAVKQLFDNFATRTMAYDFHHIISLMKFDSRVQSLHTFTENLEIFRDHIHSLQANGCTALYDALHHGRVALETEKHRFPDCRLRIICLTDGNDSGSAREPVSVTNKLLASQIIVDSILVGDVGNNVLHGISNVTGGCCFKPASSRDGLKLFEMETVLSLELRKPKQGCLGNGVSTITSESMLRSFFASRGYDEKPQVTLPAELDNKVTVTKNTLKRRIVESKSGHFMETHKRILEELKSLHCDPHPFYTVFPSESVITFWKILMQGPPGTPYEQGVFELFCQFGEDYPVKPPLLRFITPVYHCNVNSVGRICHNIFDRNYSAHITMREILDAVYGLLIIPEPEDPLDSILAEEFMTSREVYEQEAKKKTEEMAGNSLDDLEMKLVGPEETDSFVPPHLICPLTRKMFVDPVKTKYGTVYERKAIEKHLKEETLDPVKKQPLYETDLTPHQGMRKMVIDHRNKQIEE